MGRFLTCRLLVLFYLAAGYHVVSRLTSAQGGFCRGGEYAEVKLALRSGLAQIGTLYCILRFVEKFGFLLLF